MADDLNNREGKAAGGRLVQRLILCVCVFVCTPGRKATYVLFTVHTRRRHRRRRRRRHFNLLFYLTVYGHISSRESGEEWEFKFPVSSFEFLHFSKVKSGRNSSLISYDLFTHTDPFAAV